MSEHPRLRWEKKETGHWRTNPSAFLIIRLQSGYWGACASPVAGFGRTLGFAENSDGAKAIAQAFADSETLRGRP